MAGAPQGGAPQGGAPQNRVSGLDSPAIPQQYNGLNSPALPQQPQGQGFNPWLSQLGASTQQAQPALARQGIPTGTNQDGGGMQQDIQQFMGQQNPQPQQPQQPLPQQPQWVDQAGGYTQPPLNNPWQTQTGNGYSSALPQGLIGQQSDLSSININPWQPNQPYQGPGADILAQLQAQQNQAQPQPQAAPALNPGADQAGGYTQPPLTLPPQMAANIARQMPQGTAPPWMMQKRPIPSGQRIAGNPTAMEIGGQGLSRLPRDRSAPQ
jgi:hypothetical protein